MKKHLTFTFLTLSLLLLPLVARDFILKGKVINSRTGEPLVGAEVFLVSSRTGTITDGKGEFRLTVTSSALNDTVLFRYLGFEEKRISVRELRKYIVVSLTEKSLPLSDSILIQGERIDVVAQEIPHSREVLTDQEIQMRGVSEVSDLFKSIPSVTVEGNEISGRHIQIRGSDPREVNVYIDGVLVNALSGDGTADLSIIPLESVEKIEVLKGANLTLLGNGAFGGVIYITTRRDVQRRVSLKSRLGSFHSQYFTGDVNLPISRRVLIRYFGQISKIKPLIEFFPGERFSDKSRNNNITSTRYNHHLQLDVFLPGGRFSSRMFGYRLDYRKPFLTDERQNILWSTIYEGNVLGTPHWEIQSNYLSGKDRVERSSTGSSRVENVFQTRQLNVRFLKRFVQGDNEIQLFGEYIHDELQSTANLLETSNSIEFYDASLYENRLGLAGVVKFTNRFQNYPNIFWHTHLGMRGDILANGDEYFSPSLGFQINISGNQWEYVPYFNYGKNVKIQTLLDNALVSLLDINESDTVLVRLEPEVSNAAEVGVQINQTEPGKFYEKLQMSFSLFRNTVFNKLLRRPLEPLTVNSQIGRNISQGVEFLFSIKGVFNTMNLNSSAMLLDISNPLLYAYKPRHRFSFRMEFPDLHRGYASVTLFQEGEAIAWFYDVNNELAVETIPAFYDVDLTAGYRFRWMGVEGNIQLSALNIFDNSGYRFYLLKKRFLQASISLAWK